MFGIGFLIRLSAHRRLQSYENGWKLDETEIGHCLLWVDFPRSSRPDPFVGNVTLNRPVKLNGIFAGNRL